jgi:hypothetical protein
MGSFMGADSGGVVIFLVKNDILFSVKIGEILEQTYRIDAFSAGRLTVTYLPLNMQQIIILSDKR